ncbi:hypothetical protein [Pantoea vagans]|uniref:hypothetical protein n=1 Tax=Pantoea vagans TaxID=470934 RepID=UPI0028ECDAAA|nr:hypothetical protein [Pantoea vagans]
MENREAAKKVTETFFDVAEKMYESVGMIDACAKEGEVSKEEAEAYHTCVMDTLEELYDTIVSPIYDRHPDLRPTCRCCKPEENEEDPQP